MVFLHQQSGSSRKRPSSFNSPFPQPKIQKSTTDPAAVGSTETETSSIQSQPQITGVGGTLPVEKMVSILAEAGCTLVNPAGPPCLPTDHHKFRCHLHRILTSGATHRSEFLAGLAVYIDSPKNLRRVLTSSSPDGYFTPRCNSLVRNLLLVPSIQLDIQKMLLEKLPEYFQVNSGVQDISLPLRDDVPRLIINHFRWLDFVVDCNAFNDMLLQVLSICPLQLKKEIIGSLPEIVGDLNNKIVVDYLEQMLQEDSSIIVPVLDSLSNLHLDDELKEQVITIALSCIRTIDGEHMPYLLRFLVLSATPTNSRRIISQIREQLKFIGVSSHFASQDKNKLKGKSLVDSTDASILDTLRSGLRFKTILCQEMLKEFSCIHRPQDHRVIDIWLLVLIYANGDSAKRSIEKIFKKKVNDGCFQEILIDQCIRGHADLVQANFPSFLALSENLLACKEQRAREFSVHMYACLFEELSDTYSRQEVLGALVTHVGSGVSFEVTSALETLKLLVSKYAQELIPLSSHINGILDYLEGFNFENLNKVYDVFSQLALSASCSVNSFRSPIADELMMIVRKQLNHPDMAYKKMGLIGTLKIVSCLGNVNNIAYAEQTEKSNCGEALELLETSLESCKHLASPLTFLYDEMAFMLDNETLHPAFMEWISKHAGDLEYTFLSDLEDGQLPSRKSDCGLEGELWMNLDGDISPVCLNILPLVVSSNQSSLLQILPANLQLLSTIERSTNQGSLGGIDALLGCPLHMPSSKYFCKDAWQSLTGKQKQLVCLSLYYAANWIRELLNAFSSQVAGKFECTSQATKEDIITKLLKRLRNLVFLETILSKYLECCPLSLPELHHQFEHSGPSPTKHAFVYEEKSVLKRASNLASPKLKKDKRLAKSQTVSTSDGKYRQPTIVDVLKRAGVLTNEPEANDHSSTLPSRSTSHSADQNSSDYDESSSVEVSMATKILDLQRFKFRPFQHHCYSIMTFSKNQNRCCSDPMAELPVYLYLLRDLQYKLDCFTNSGRKCGPSDISGTKLRDLLQKIRPLFSSLKKYFDNSMILLREGENGCQGHWEAQSCSSGNPILSNVFHSTTSSSSSFIEEILHFLTKILDLPDIQMDKTILLDLLSAFQPIKALDFDFPGVQTCPVPGSIEYLYYGAYSFLEDVLDKACSFSFTVASESLLSLETLVRLAKKCSQKNAKHTKLEFSEGLLLNLHRRLGIAAEKVMKHNWDEKNIENGWKRQGERVQKLLRIYLENSDCTSTLLNQIACSILPEVSLYQTAAEEDSHHDFSTLRPATYLIWYRVLHEVNLTVLHTLVKEVSLRKAKEFMTDKAKELLTELLMSVNVVVSLVNVCRTHDKVTLHAMAVKYGGKFIDAFMKVFDFLQVQFQAQNNELVMQIVKELQKATRTLQTLCSEAKGSKQTAITSKVPGMKRSLERFLFRVKALVVATSSGCTFWMGNLKHKDLAGQVVSSQAYLDENHETEVGDDDEEPPVADVSNIT